MNEMIQIRSVKQYFNDFIADKDLSTPAARAQIKLQILDGFRKEIFEQIFLKMDQILPMSMKEKMKPGVLDLNQIANLDTVHNILVNAFRKWRRLCMLCNDAGLVNWLNLDDLKKMLEEEEAPDGTVQGSDTDGDETMPIIDAPEEDPEPFEPERDEQGNLIPQTFPAGYWTR